MRGRGPNGPQFRANPLSASGQGPASRSRGPPAVPANGTMTPERAGSAEKALRFRDGIRARALFRWTDNGDVQAFGVLAGATATLLIMRFAVPANVRENPRWQPVLALGMAFGALAGGWIGSLVRDMWDALSTAGDRNHWEAFAHTHGHSFMGAAADRRATPPDGGQRHPYPPAPRSA